MFSRRSSDGDGLARSISLAACVLLLLFAPLAANAQQCYYAPGQLALAQYVPCSSVGVSACCLAGDYCLDDNACYSPSTTITYIAGCTDSSYTNAACGAQTCNKTTQFQALAICNNDNWVCCKESGQTGTIPGAHDPVCPCNSGYVTVITAATSLGAVTSLPSTFSTNAPSSSAPASSAAGTTGAAAASSTGGGGGGTSVVLLTSVVTDKLSASGGATAVTLLSSSTATGTVPPGINLSIGSGVSGTGAAGSSPSNGVSSSSSGSNSHARTIGLAVGIPVGVLFLAGIAAAIFFYRRRRARGPPPQQDMSTTTWLGDVSGPGGAAGATAGAGAGTGAATAATAAAASEPPPRKTGVTGGGGRVVPSGRTQAAAAGGGFGGGAPQKESLDSEGTAVGSGNGNGNGPQQFRIVNPD